MVKLAFLWHYFFFLLCTFLAVQNSHFLLLVRGVFFFFFLPGNCAFIIPYDPDGCALLSQWENPWLLVSETGFPWHLEVSEFQNTCFENSWCRGLHVANPSKNALLLTTLKQLWILLSQSPFIPSLQFSYLSSILWVNSSSAYARQSRLLLLTLL